MRIGFVTQPGHAVFPAVGSLELWTEAVACRLAERHEVTIYASRPRVVPDTRDDAVTYRFVGYGSGRTVTRALRRAWRLLPDTRPFFASGLHPLEYWIRVAADIRRRKIEVVHVFNYSQAVPILRRMTRAKLVLHMQCEWLNQLDERMISGRLRHADLVVGCSDYITGKVQDRFPRYADRCVTIHNGIDVDTAPPPAGGDSDAKEVRLLTLGRVSPEKGLHVLVDALERVVAVHPNVRLTIVGEESPVPYEFAVKISSDNAVRRLGRFYTGSYLQTIRDRMSTGVAERVTFVDRVAHEETQRYYAAADIFVYPSIFESFAIPPVEAMAEGVPVVASRVGGMQETILHERTGLLVEREDPVALASALNRLIEDQELRRSLGDAGRARAVAMFSWPRITSAVERAFSALVEPHAIHAGSPSISPG